MASLVITMPLIPCHNESSIVICVIASNRKISCHCTAGSTWQATVLVLTLSVTASMCVSLHATNIRERLRFLQDMVVASPAEERRGAPAARFGGRLAESAAEVVQRWTEGRCVPEKGGPKPSKAKAARVFNTRWGDPHIARAQI